MKALENLTQALGPRASKTGVATRVGGWFFRHLVTFVALVTIVGVYVFVPPIDHMAEVPSFEHASGFEVFAFWSYLQEELEEGAFRRHARNVQRKQASRQPRT